MMENTFMSATPGLAKSAASSFPNSSRTSLFHSASASVVSVSPMTSQCVLATLPILLFCEAWMEDWRICAMAKLSPTVSAREPSISSNSPAPPAFTVAAFPLACSPSTSPIPACNRSASRGGVNQVSGGFTVADARVYFSNGSIFNADTGQSAGTFNGLTLSAASPYVDPSTQRALFVERSITNSTLAAYDTATLARVGSFPLPGVTGSASSIRRWGTDGIAFRSTSGIAIVRTTLAGIPEQPPRFDGITSSGGNIVLHFTATTPGQYQLEYTPQIGMAFSAQGTPFTETTTQLQFTAPSPQGFFRIVRLP